MLDAESADACFVCDERTANEAPLVRLCECRLVHDACKEGYRRLHRGSVHEVFCTECNSLHATLPRRSGTYVALVGLHLPDCKPSRCAVSCGPDGEHQLRALASTTTGWHGRWRLTAFCQVDATDRFAQIDGWRHWRWMVYCIANTQARHGAGGHWLELVRDATEISSRPFSMV